MLGEKPDARVVLMGQDEGALAVLLARAKGLPQAVAAVAAESPTLDIPQIARETLEDAGESVGALEEMLLGAAYRLAFGEKLERISEERFAGGGVPTRFSRVRWMSSRLLMSRRISPPRWAVGQRSA